MIDYLKIPEIRLKILKKDEELREKIERETGTKISINEDLKIEGESFNIYQAKQILRAFGRGFDVEDCLKLLDDEYGLEIIDLTDFTRSRNRLTVIKGRVIGTKGKTKKFIEEYTKTKISVFGKTVSIIGKWENINIAKEAIMRLIRGSAHQSVYKWLERRVSEVKW